MIIINERVKASHAKKNLVSEIHNIQGQNAELYSVVTASISQPILFIDNMGTGYGKTYGRIKRYIIDTYISDTPWRNLIFVTPQKAQIHFPFELLKVAYDKGIAICCCLSRDDLGNLEFENWVPDKKGQRRRNKEIYSFWCASRQIVHSSVRGALTEIELRIKSIDSLTQWIQRFINDPVTPENIKKQQKDRLTSEKKNLANSLGILASEVARQHSDFEELCETIHSDSKRSKLYKDILSHLAPFTIAACQPCIMLATSKKFDQNIFMPRVKKDVGLELTLWPFDSILSGCMKPPEVPVSGVAMASHDDQISFMKKQLFKKDKNSFFLNNNIAFDLVIDEEHDAYEIFAESIRTPLITENHNIAHAIATVYDLYQQIKITSPEEKKLIPLRVPKMRFIRGIDFYIDKYSDFSSRDRFERTLQLFSDNIDEIVINSSEAEQILGIARNIFKLGRTQYTNSRGMKSVRFRRICGLRTMVMYYQRSSRDSNPSLYEVYQLFMAILYSASILGDSKNRTVLPEGNARSRDNLVHYLKTEDNKNEKHSRPNRNTPLAELIHHAAELHGPLGSLLDVITDDKQVVNHFFVYVCSKILLTIEPRKNLDFRYDIESDLVLVDFRLTLSSGSPEMSLTRILYDTLNTVTLMSATTGFSGHYLNKYSRDYFETFFNWKMGENLDIGIVLRNDPKPVQKLRELRGDIRSIKFSSFDPSDVWMGGRTNDFKTVHETYWKALFQEGVGINPYHIYEAKRQLTALLAAAWDERNTLSLGINSRFIQLLSSVVKKMETNNYPGLHLKELTPSLDGDGHVFEFRPFPNKSRVRVVLFTAKLGKRAELRDWMTLDQNDCSLVMISYRKAAGTGVNFYPAYLHSLEDVKENPFEIDFERLVLVNSPYWSRVIQDKDEQHRSLYSLHNMELLFRWYAHRKPNTPLLSFDMNSLDQESIQFLWNQHRAAHFETTNQNNGRSERKNGHIQSEILLPNDLIEDMCVEFTSLESDSHNHSILEMMSFQNHSFWKHCQKITRQICFSSSDKQDEELIRLHTERKTAAMYVHLKSFFENTVPHLIKQARNNNCEMAMDFNDRLRSILSIENPEAYIKQLLESQWLKDNPREVNAIKSFYLDLTEYPKNIKFCLGENPLNDEEYLTDLKGSLKPYHIEKILTPTSPFMRGMEVDPKVRQIARQCPKNISKHFRQYLPMPFLARSLIKGNLGEHIIFCLLNSLDAVPMGRHQWQPILSPKAYELFDFYLDQGNTLLCIDAKNFSLNIQHTEADIDKSLKTLKWKREELSKLLPDSPWRKARFLYLNCWTDNNGRHLASHRPDGNSAWLLNAFQVNKIYHPARDERAFNSKLVPQVTINPQVVKLITNLEVSDAYKLE